MSQRRVCELYLYLLLLVVLSFFVAFGKRKENILVVAYKRAVAVNDIKMTAATTTTTL